MPEEVKKKQRPPLSQELKAMHQIDLILNALQPDEIERVMAWLVSRYDHIVPPAPTGGTPNGP